MSRIYFDSNVFSNLRINNDPKYQQLNLLLSEYKKNLSIFFSHAHIRDKLKDSSEYKFLDFSFMETLTGDNYISYDGSKNISNFYLATPLMAYTDEYDTPNDFQSLLKAINDGLGNSIVAKQVMSILKAQLEQEITIDKSVFQSLKNSEKEVISKFIPFDKQKLTVSDIISSQLQFQVS